MTAALSNLRVVELSDGLPVAYCGRQFALWGADVVRLCNVVAEAPGSCFDPIGLQDLYVHANKTVKEFAPRGSGSGGELAELLGLADVFLTDWDPARLRALGITTSDLASACPGLVILSFSDFGRTGPYSAFQATDLVLQALSGYMSFNGEPDREPLKAPANAVPFACGLNAFIGALAALRERNVSGRGQVVEVAALEAVSSLTQYTRTQYYRTPVRRHGSIGPPMLPCEDGFLYLNYLLEAARGSLLLALGLEEKDALGGEDGIYPFLAQHTRHWKAKDLFDALGLLGQNCGIVRNPEQVIDCDHLRAREFFHELPHAGRVLQMPGAPVHMSQTPASAPRLPATFAGWTKREGRTPERGMAAAVAPLAGVRVLDLTQAWLGPYAAMLLADLRADVIKVESPVRPDVWRNVSDLPPSARPGAHRWNTCHFFNSVNRNKRSLTLDLADQRGKALFLRLVRGADVVMENYTPRVMDNFGLGYQVLCEINPRLVMVSFSGYGKTGPRRDFKATGATIETVAGWDSIFGYPDRPPFTMGEYPVDPMAGLHMTASALLGLLACDSSGRGQAIEGSMIEAAVGYIGEEILMHSAKPENGARMANRHRRMAPHGVFPCAGEDEWVAIAVRDDPDWQALRSVIDETILRDSRYLTEAGRLAAVEELERVLSAWTRQRSGAETMARLQEAGVPAGIVQGPDQALDDPHLAARSWFKLLHHADLGTHKYYGFPWSFSRTPLFARLPPPRLGEHYAEVLRERLGLSDGEIEALVAAGVTGAVLEESDGPQRARMPRRRR